MSTHTVEFSEWKTPFENGNLVIIGVVYLNGELFVDFPSKNLSFRDSAKFDMTSGALVVRLFQQEDQNIYVLTFPHVSAFRVLDEGGLLELWEASSKGSGRPANATFKVRNHMWSKESPLSFGFSDDDRWSYVVATDFDCVEVVGASEPKIEVEKSVPSQPVYPS